MCMEALHTIAISTTMIITIAISITTTTTMTITITNCLGVGFRVGGVGQDAISLHLAGM